MKQFGKILKFELKGYLKNKVFTGVTIFLVVAIAVAMFIPNIISAFKTGTTPSKDLPVMLVYAEDETLSKTVKEYFTQAFTGYNVKVADGTLDDIKSQITSGSVECAFVLNSPSSYTYYVNNLNMRDSNQAVADTVLQEVYRVNAMIQNGLSPEPDKKLFLHLHNDICIVYGYYALRAACCDQRGKRKELTRYGGFDYERKAYKYDVRKGFCVLYRRLYSACACVRVGIAVL